MAGLLAGSSLNNATTAYQNLQVPYPEFGGISESTHAIGTSLYNSLQVSVEKRLSAGLQGRLSYTWDKIMQASGHGFLHNVLGGWEANGIIRYLNGSLVSAPGSVFSTGVNPKLSNPTYSQWFNTCTLNTSGVRTNCINASQPVAFMVAPAYTLRTLSTVMPGVRTQVPTTMDFSLFKTFEIHEKFKVQFRANAYNLANTPVFGGPNTSTGVIGIGQVNDPRIVELALKLNF